MKTILCIDTASERFALALDTDGEVRSFESTEPQEHTRQLLPAIQTLLGDTAPDAILAVIGPGAYAGIRVGLATAEGLAVARDIPVYGIGTLEAAAIAVAAEGPITIIHPAGRGEFAAQPFESGSPAGNLALLTPAQLRQPFAGQGAGAIGGVEVTPLQRCLAALADRAPRIRAGQLDEGAEPFYLREPSITVSRRLRTTAS
ncbi:MAG TPA: tRNA (adenosine(37)-N6)-threonylcarbamoyltransferase complex dimerization subunit type 1 TsaB [Tepidiformaceae bacterium]|nr:tRNA (adenosine(37)-N6)-threonylcarbamoyltransferase complex dimerization subunit type 1 TsaB [Tepidiformaceae bacterium]